MAIRFCGSLESELKFISGSELPCIPLLSTASLRETRQQCKRKCAAALNALCFSVWHSLSHEVHIEPIWQSRTACSAGEGQGAKQNKMQTGTVDFQFTSLHVNKCTIYRDVLFPFCYNGLQKVPFCSSFMGRKNIFTLSHCTSLPG